MGPGEIVSAHAVLGLGVSDDGFDRRAAAEFAFDGLGDAASLARDIDLELVVGRGVVAAIAAVGDDAREVRADLRLDLRDHGRERVAVVGVAGQRLGVGDELAAPGAIERGGERDLDAELIGPMGLALADALDLGRVQRIDLLSALMLALLAHPAGQHQRMGEDALQFGLALDLAHDVANDPAEIGADRPQRPVGALELLGVGVALMGDQRMFADPLVGLAQLDARLPGPASPAARAPDA